MSDSEDVIRHSGDTAIGQLFATAYQQAEWLSHALDDDAEAMRVLSVPLALHEAAAAADRAWVAESIGREERPLFDDRDQARWAWLNGFSTGFSPAPSRAQERLNDWGQRNGFIAFTRLYQGALTEVRGDGTSAAKMVEAVYEAHKHLLDVARQLTDERPLESSRCAEWGTAHAALLSALSELMPHCPAPPPKANEDQGDEPPKETGNYEARAIAYFLQEAKRRPANEITKAEMISRFDCAESTLSKGRAPTLHALMEAHKSQRSGASVRRGSKSVDGTIEASD